MDENVPSNHPLVKTLPPATDYINYLIVVEHNLTKDSLPILHHILQDTQLTANIGWDLVHLLLPFLPESKSCLLDIARLGNPREVVLKVTELLGTVGAGDDEEEEVDDRFARQNDKQSSTADDRQASGQDSKSSQLVHRYSTLVEMLAILHPRIRTKYPSRFLSTSLQAVLPAYAYFAQDPRVIDATLDLVKALSPTRRPRLPPRRSSSQVPTASTLTSSAPDPEGQEASAGPEEDELQVRLVQAFLSFVVEGYVLSLRSYENIPGLAWSCRYFEKEHPDKQVPGRPTVTELYAAEDEDLHLRDTVIGQFLAISRDLEIKTDDLLASLLSKDALEESESDELPSKASDVPLARAGSLFLYTASLASFLFFGAPKITSPSVFIPQLADLVSPGSFDGVESSSEAITDTILFLVAWTLDVNGAFDFRDDEIFHKTIQQFSVLSSQCASAPLRYQAHLLASRILHDHPSPEARLAYITDTLEHCPYENLKASAVGWLKDEILHAQKKSGTSASVDSSVFASSDALLKTAPFLLVDPSAMIKQGGPATTSTTAQATSGIETYEAFLQHQSFILAVLNLLYLLLSSRHLIESLSIKSLGSRFDVIGYCDRMRAATLLFHGWLVTYKEGIRQDAEPQKFIPEDHQHARRAELLLLEQTIDRVMQAAGTIDL